METSSPGKLPLLLVGFVSAAGEAKACRILVPYLTLPETNTQTQKGPYKDYSPSKRGLYGFPC